MADCAIMSFNLARAKDFDYKPTFMDNLIAQRSWPYKHTEYRFSARYGCISFSATTADGANSARFKQIGYSHFYEFWDRVMIPMTNKQEDLAWAEACKLADLPINWMDNLVISPDKIYKGSKAIPYDTFGQVCHILTWEIYKPSEKKTWCTRGVCLVVCAARPSFAAFLQERKKIRLNELRPDQLHYLAEYYFRKEVV